MLENATNLSGKDCTVSESSAGLTVTRSGLKVVNKENPA